MSTLRYFGVCVLLAGSFCYADPMTNLVVNGGFETGNFTGWSVSGNVTPCLFVGTAGDARCIPTTAYGGETGNYAAELGNSGGDASLSQAIQTTGTGTYEVSFWLASQSYGTPSNDFSVTWGNTTLMSGINLPAFGYTQYDFKGLTAAGPTTTLQFKFQNNPSFLTLDNVAVVDAVPEPGLLGLLGFLPAAALTMRRRKCC